jgi:hypothetical protein
MEKRVRVSFCELQKRDHCVCFACLKGFQDGHGVRGRLLGRLPLIPRTPPPPRSHRRRQINFSLPLRRQRLSKRYLLFAPQQFCHGISSYFYTVISRDKLVWVFLACFRLNLVGFLVAFVRKKSHFSLLFGLIKIYSFFRRENFLK